MDRWPSPPRSSRRITSRIHSSARKSLRPGKLSDLCPAPLSLASQSRGKRDLELWSLSEMASGVGFQNCHVPSDFTGAPKCTGNRYVLESAASAPWCTCTTLEGVECQNSSGAKHRSCTTTKLNGTITPSPPAQKAWTPPRLQASLQAAPPHHCSGLYGHAKSTQPAWLVAS